MTDEKPRVVTIEPHGAEQFSVRYDFDLEANAVLREHRGWWVPADRCWCVRDKHAAICVADALHSLGFRVLATGLRRDAPAPESGGTDQHVTVLADLLAEFGLPAYRALTKVTHPDVGGTTEWSQALNVAWERAQRRAS